MLARLHQWFGLVSAGVLLVISLSGFSLLWMDEYLEWRYPELTFDSILVQPDASVIARLMTSVEPSISSLGMPTISRPFYHAYLTNRTQQIFHPLTGTLIADWTWRDSFPVFLFELHARLLAGEIGFLVVGVAGIILLLSVVSGLILWIRHSQVLKLRFVVPTNLSSLKLLQSHAAQGVVLSLLFVILGVTGVALVFPEPFRFALGQTFGESGLSYPEAESVAYDGPANWPVLLGSVQREYPTSVIRFITPASRGDAPIIVRLKLPEEFHPDGRSFVTLVPDSGLILQRINATQRGGGPLIFDVFYPVHSGKTNWPGHRLLLALAGLSLMYLGASGVTLYLRRTLSSSSVNE